MKILPRHIPDAMSRSMQRWQKLEVLGNGTSVFLKQNARGLVCCWWLRVWCVEGWSGDHPGFLWHKNVSPCIFRVFSTGATGSASNRGKKTFFSQTRSPVRPNGVLFSLSIFSCPFLNPTVVPFASSLVSVTHSMQAAE